MCWSLFLRVFKRILQIFKNTYVQLLLPEVYFSGNLLLFWVLEFTGAWPWPPPWICIYLPMPSICVYRPWLGRLGNNNSQSLVQCYPIDIYLLKVNNRNTRTRHEICSKLAIKTPERRHWRRSSVFVVHFRLILHLALVFLLLTLSRQMPAGLNMLLLQFRA